MSPVRDPQTEWARMVLASFAEAGVHDVVVSPGSRSTPFALAAAGDARLRLHSIIDERSAGFFALGQAKASGRPSLLLCTSGSAPAHYFPAIVEARHSRTPLLVLTADRPLEAQHAGAHQTVDQTAMFGRYVEAAYELGAWDASPAALRGCRRLIAQAVGLASDAPGGAVHLNLRARKPLEPYTPDGEERAAAERIRAAAQLPLLATAAPESAATTGLDRLARAIAEVEEGLIVVGPSPARERRLLPAVLALAEATGYPVALEPTSQLLGTRHAFALPALLPVLFASAAGRAALRPRLVLQLGGPPVASGYERLLSESPAPQLQVIARSIEVDSESRASAIHLGDPLLSLEGLTRALAGLRVKRAGSAWSKRARSLDADARRGLRALLEPRGADDEVGMVSALLRAASESAPLPTLFVGNSLPVRELALAAAIQETPALTVLHQRGASGIDGLCSGAAGIASLGGPVIALIGDVSLLHDLHGLHVMREARTPLVLVVIQNGGGRIFDQLPVGTRADLQATMPLFTTPVAPDLELLARFNGLRYARVEARAALAPVVASCLAHPGPSLLELRVDPNSAAALAARLAQVIP